MNRPYRFLLAAVLLGGCLPGTQRLDEVLFHREPGLEPDFCAPVGSGDCRYHDFQGERTPRYEAVEVDAARGHVAFTVRMPAVRGGSALRVRSEDRGGSWSVEPRDDRIRRSAARRRSGRRGRDSPSGGR